MKHSCKFKFISERYVMFLLSVRFQTSLFLLSLCFSSVNAPKAIIFDLGDTLIMRDTGRIASHVGYWNGFWTWLAYGNQTKKKVGDLLVEVLSDGTELQRIPTPLDTESRVMPSIMCEWFMGNVACKQALDYSLLKIEAFPFEKNRDRNIINATVQWMFNPKNFARAMKPIPGAINLLKDLAGMKDKKGKRLHQLYIISNFDPESYDYLYDWLPAVFKYFYPKNIEVSGIVKAMKPNPSIFYNFMKKHKLNPKDCIFVDDQKENVISARNCGMNAIQVVGYDYKPVREQLQDFGVAVKA